MDIPKPKREQGIVTPKDPTPRNKWRKAMKGKSNITSLRIKAKRRSDINFDKANNQ